KATIFFRGREMAHPEIGRRILERLVQELAEVAIAETMPRMEGNQMHTILSRKPQSGGGKAKPAAARQTTSTEKRLQVNDGEQTETQDAPRRRQALQAHEGRKVSAEQSVQAAHPEQQVHEAEAPPEGHDHRGGRRHAEARADVAVQIVIRD